MLGHTQITIYNYDINKKIDSLMLIGITPLFIFVHVHKCLKYRNTQNKHRNKTTGIFWILYFWRKMTKRFILYSLLYCSPFQKAWLSKFIQPSGFGHHHILQGILGNELQRPNTMHIVLFVKSGCELNKDRSTAADSQQVENHLRDNKK